MLHCRLCYCEELIIHHAIICEVYMQLVLFLMVHLSLKLLPGPSLIICVNINWFPLWSLSPPLSSLLLISYFWDVRHDNTSLLVFYVLTKCNTSGAPASPLQFSIYWSSCNSISSCCTLCWEVSWLERSVTFNLSHLCIVLSSTFQVLMRSGKKKIVLLYCLVSQASGRELLTEAAATPATFLVFSSPLSSFEMLGLGYSHCSLRMTRIEVTVTFEYLSYVIMCL